MLKRESGAIFKMRSEPTTYSLACNLLLFCLKDSNSWPESVAKVRRIEGDGQKIIFFFLKFKTYIDDATGDRVWVDLKQCKKLVDNILTIFNTRTIGGSSDEGGQQEESEGTVDALSGLVGNIPVQPR